MNRPQTRVGALTTTYKYSPCPIARLDRVRFFLTRSSIAYLLGTGALLLPMAGFAQSLNDAVTSQLEIRNFVPCAQLRGGQPNPDSYLTEPLRTICKRGGGSSGTTPSASTGGGTATPTSLPSIVQQRLRETRGEEKKLEIKPKTGGASADAVAEYANGLGLFISGEFQRLDRNITTFEDGYGSDIWRVAAGADYQFTDRILAGFGFDYYQQDGDFDGGGDFEVKSYGLIGFGSFLPTDKTFVQFYGGYARGSYKRDRPGLFSDLNPDDSLPADPTASGIQHADYNAGQYSAGLLGGYDYPIGNVRISPRAGVDFRHIDFGTYSEKGVTGLELTFHDESQTWLQTRVGGKALVVFKTSFGMIVPQVSFDWKHEFENDQRNVQVSFVGDTRANRFTYQTERPDRDWFVMNARVSAVLLQGLQPFVNYRVLVGHSFFDSHAGTIGLRYAF